MIPSPSATSITTSNTNYTGPLILRADTAAIVILSVLNHELQRD